MIWFNLYCTVKMETFLFKMRTVDNFSENISESKFVLVVFELFNFFAKDKIPMIIGIRRYCVMAI